MAGFLDQFLEQFAGGSAPAATSASEFHERFVSRDEKDRDFDNDTYHDAATEHLQQLPDDQFQDAARNAVAQVGPEQRQDLLGGLLSALGGAGALGGMTGGAGGGGIGQIARALGLGTTDPQRMSEEDASKLINYARKERPEALRQTVAEKPWFVQALGNPIVMGALTMAATRLLSRRR